MKEYELEPLIRRLVLEALGGGDACPVKQVCLHQIETTEGDRLNTGNPSDRVYTHDLFPLSVSPRLGAGIMEMTDSRFPWHLDYDEMDYVIQGRLTVEWGGKQVTAEAGELIYIPKGSDIHFAVTGHSRFLYVTYPADWAEAGAAPK